MTRAALALGLVAGLVARADLAPPTPPLVPEGILDARGQLGFFRTKDGNVAAVELSTGEIRWSASEGVWPLHADLHTVAVAALDPRSSGVLRVRFLRLSLAKIGSLGLTATCETDQAAGPCGPSWSPC